MQHAAIIAGEAALNLLLRHPLELTSRDDELQTAWVEAVAFGDRLLRTSLDSGVCMSDSIAFALRYSESHAPREGTIRAHERVLASAGYVWFGKLGRPVGPSLLRRLSSQIGSGEKVDLVLVSPRQGADYEFHLCSVDTVSQVAPAGSDPGIPPYYSDLPDTPSSWLRVSSIRRAEPALVDQLTLAATGGKLSDALRRSMTGLYILEPVR